MEPDILHIERMEFGTETFEVGDVRCNDIARLMNTALYC
jgi:hypothetical protein